MTYYDAQLDALGDPTRRAILAQLLDGPKPVVELARGFTISRPAVSQHLRVLKDARLVTDRPEGNRRIYQLNPQGFEELRQYFDRFWGDALAAFQRQIELPTTEDPR
jgi:DNA-binding transcriptional ArsR family regulator